VRIVVFCHNEGRAQLYEGRSSFTAAFLIPSMSSLLRPQPFSSSDRPDGSQDGAGGFLDYGEKAPNAGPSGVRRPCSQLRTVLTLTPNAVANSAWTAQVSLSWPPRRHRVLGPYGRGHVPSRLA